MKEELKNFLVSIDHEPLIIIIEKILKFYESIIPEEVSDILAEVFYSKDHDTYEYGNLFFFSKNYQCIIPNYTEIDRKSASITIFPLNQNIECLNIQTENYAFNDSTLISKMEVEYRLITGKKVIIKAASRNCNILKEIITNYLKPNLNI